MNSNWIKFRLFLREKGALVEIILERIVGVSYSTCVMLRNANRIFQNEPSFSRDIFFITRRSFRTR